MAETIQQTGHQDEIHEFAFKKEAGILFAVIFGYSLYLWLWSPVLPLPSPLPLETPQLKTLLFQKEGAYDVYLADTQNRASTGTGTNLLSIRFIDEKTLLKTTSSGVIISDIRGKQNMPLQNINPKFIFSVRRDRKEVYTTKIQNGLYWLTVHLTECDGSIDIPISQKPIGYSPMPTFSSLNLPLQRNIRLSPHETSLFLLDHSFFPRIALVNLVERKAQILFVPGFSSLQIHFSPIFLDDGRLLFSVMDGDRQGTILYNIQNDTYETYSKNFTDYSYISVSGKIALIQSFYLNGSLNIPFGSRAIYEQKTGIKRPLIHALIGTDRRAERIRMLLFEDPLAQYLRFKTTLEDSDFMKIGNITMRTGLQKLWNEQKDSTTIPKGSIHILRGASSNDMKDVKIFPMSPDPLTRHFRLEQKLGPLLEALEVPLPLVGDIERKRTNAENKGGTYELVDLLW